MYSTTNIKLVIKQAQRDEQGMWHVWGSGETRTRLWWGELREREHLEDLGVDGG